MTDSQEKTCLACRLSIHAEAKRCPNCKTWQTKWSLTAVKPSFYLVLAAILIGLLSIMFYDISKHALRADISFAEFEKAIVVTDSNLNYFETDTCAYITCVGHLRNDSDVTWERPRIEVQFLGVNGELIDTIAEKQYGLVLPPHKEVAFRVRARAARPKEEYVTQKVFVRWAEDAK